MNIKKWTAYHYRVHVREIDAFIFKVGHTGINLENGTNSASCRQWNLHYTFRNNIIYGHFDQDLLRKGILVRPLKFLSAERIKELKNKFVPVEVWEFSSDDYANPKAEAVAQANLLKQKYIQHRIIKEKINEWGIEVRPPKTQQQLDEEYQVVRQLYLHGPCRDEHIQSISARDELILQECVVRDEITEHNSLTPSYGVQLALILGLNQEKELNEDARKRMGLFAL